MRGLHLRILRPILTLSLAAPLLAGCLQVRGGGAPAREVSPEERLSSGILAWRQGDYRTAALELSRLATDPPTPQFGERARLALAALEIDPRNESGDLANGTALAAELAADTAVSGTTGSIGEVLYLLAREVGAEPPSDTTLLPSLPGTPLATRLDQLQQERDAHAQEIARLQQALKEKNAEIEGLKRELERIRKTLRP